MKTVINKITLLAAALLIWAVPSVADEGAINPASEPALQGGKDECLLVAMNCPNQTDSIQQKIERIQREIDKGDAVYTNEELKSLRDKLEDTERNYEHLIEGA